MSELLLEVLSEEIPARMQTGAAKDLERLVVGALSDRGLLFEAVRSFAGPRRIGLAISGLPAKQPDVTEEKKGPRVDANEKAIAGFLKSAGVEIGACEHREDAKGAFYVAVLRRQGRATSEVLAELLPEALAKLPWPKSMRWGSSSFRWVRPLHGIVAAFDGEIVPFSFGGVAASRTTHGHRFLSRGTIDVRRFDDYLAKLRDAYVIVDAAERREIIVHEMKQRAFALGLEPIADEGLANEVMGLAEWPVVLVGTIDQAFMDVPAEILQTSMRTHQKYFSLRDPATLALANKFVVVANMITDDGGEAIVAGNERVLRARLSDAKFFWDQDRKRTLESRVQDLKDIVFHAKLGTQLARVKRLEVLAQNIAKQIGADAAKAQRAALLCKADLTTGVVGEFPELQGVMGRYYALNDGEDSNVADVARDHYRPLGPTDDVPTKPLSIVVALADKLDTLTGFFAIGEKPTGSGDPFALRRAALGVIRIILTNTIRIGLRRVIEEPFARFNLSASSREADELMAFFADRLKVALREKGIRHDLIDAVFALGNEDDLVRLVRRVEALQAFLKTDDGANLLVGYRRAANISRIEEKKDGRHYRGVPDALKQDEEIALHGALVNAKTEAAKALHEEDFAGAMAVLARLRGAVDLFFEKVTVNTDDKSLRENRLKLLSQIVETAHQVADFSKVEG